MNKRQQLLKKWDDIENEYCKDCGKKGELRKIDPSSVATQQFCITECVVGLRIKQIGDELLKGE